MNFQSEPMFPEKPAAAANTQRPVLCGVGGVGVRLLKQMGDALTQWDAWTLDSESHLGGAGAQVFHLEVGSRVTRGLGCGGDAAHAQKIADAEADKIREKVHSGLMVLVAGAGGGVGAGMSQVLARQARQAGVFVVALIVEPFEFEGGLRRHNADQCRIALQGNCDVVIRVPNQAMVRVASETATVQELMGLADRHILQVLDGLMRVLHGSSLIPVGLAELERWARGRQAEGVAVVATAEGPQRARELWTSLEKHPLLESSARLQDAGGILLQVLGSEDLRLDELELIQKELQSCCPRAQVLVGAGVDNSSLGRISAFMMVVRDGSGLLQSSPDKAPDPVIYRSSPVRPLMFEDIPRAGLNRSADLGLGSGTRDAGRSKASVMANRKAQQQQFDFVPPWTGRFETADATLNQGENLDEPTFVRRGVKLN